MALPHRLLRVLPIFWSLVALSAAADEPHAAVERVARDIRYLASDELEGRGPGTAGLEKAAQYVREEFQRAGLRSGVEDGSYRQPFTMTLDTKTQPQATSLVLHGPGGLTLRLELGRDYQVMTAGGTGRVQADIVFAGYGISAPELKYDDFAGLDVAGKVLLFIRREPQQNDTKSVFDGRMVTPHSYVVNKLKHAQQRQAAAVLLVNDPTTTAAKQEDELSPANAFGSSATPLPFAHVRQAIITTVLATSPLTDKSGQALADLKAVERQIDATFQPQSQPLRGWSAELTFAFDQVRADLANVVGVLDGEGPAADESIVLGAHYDHLGYGGYGSRRPAERAIHNGADDNASGTAALLELARRLAKRPQRPPRRLIFVAFSAEERGMIGSNYYLEHPPFPLARTAAMFNYDMIGQIRNHELIVYGVRSGKEFPGLVETAGRSSGLKLRQEPGVLAGGDHYGFYQRGVPSVHFFSGLTEQYHTPEDDFPTINVPGVVRAIDYSERLLDLVAALPQRPEFLKATPASLTGGGQAYLGITPDYTDGTTGVRITTVLGNSPAEKAGLQAGDLISRFGDTPITDFASLAECLRKHKPGASVDLVVLRGTERVVCHVTLGAPPK